MGSNKVEGAEITISDFTKQHLVDTVPVHSTSNLIMPNFEQPHSNAGVGCKLQKHFHNWTLITQDKLALEVVQNGYIPKFKEQPPLVRNPDPFEYDLNELQKEALDKEIQHFLDNEVIEPVYDLNSPGYYSCLFVRPRSNDSPNRWRCIFDISKLNKFLCAPRFKMESPTTVRNFLKLNHFAVKLDLSDAFLHVPLHKSFRKYMRFFHRGRAYQFRSICFGANFSPYIFSYLMNTMMKFFHKMSIDICAYLDDCLGQHLVPSTLRHQILYVAKVMDHLGWTVNYQKSILDPIQLIDYIGLNIDYQLGLVFPPQERWRKIQQLCTYFLEIESTTAKLWSSLLGVLTSAQDMTYLGRLWLRPLQLQLNLYWKNRNNLWTQIPVSQECKLAILWWTQPENVMTGVPWTYPPPPTTHHFHRQFRPGVGRYPEQPTSIRSMVRNFCPKPHQSKGNASCVGNFDSLRKPTHAFQCISGNRQHLHSLLSKSPRRNQIHIPAKPHSENSVVVQRQGNNTQSSPHSRIIKCHERSVVEERPNSDNRMVDSPLSDRHDSTNLGTPTSGLVCHTPKSQAPTVLLPSPGLGCSGGRQHDPNMDTVPRICISSTGSDSQSVEQSETGQMPDIPDRTSLEFQELVPQPISTTSRYTQTHQTNQTSTQTTNEQYVSQEPSNIKFTRLETIRNHLTGQGFSKDPATCISERCKSPTNKLYEARWKVYTNWCHKRQVNPINISTQQLTDFLHYLATTLKLGLSAIQGYRAVINTTINLCTEREPANNIYINSLFRHYKLKQTVTDSTVPKWNLNLVLNSLIKEPYEPMLSAPLKFISWKTTFLLAFATAARVGELRALDFKQLAHDEHWSKIVLKTNPQFVAKNQDLSIDDSPRTFTIPALFDYAGPDLPDRLLCPVRALRIYKQKSKKLRTKDKKALIISYDPKHQGDITSNTISNWIKQVIKRAYDTAEEDDCTLGRITAHEVRALASSTAFSKNQSLQKINQACFWRGHSTFTSYYLRDIAMHQNGEIQLPNVVAASTKVVR